VRESARSGAGAGPWNTGSGDLCDTFERAVIRQPRFYLAAAVLLVSALVTAPESTLRHGAFAGADLKLPLGFVVAALLGAGLRSYRASARFASTARPAK
jgi:hypothetical protein